MATPSQSGEPPRFPNQDVKPLSPLLQPKSASGTRSDPFHSIAPKSQEKDANFKTSETKTASPLVVEKKVLPPVGEKEKEESSLSKFFLKFNFFKAPKKQERPRRETIRDREDYLLAHCERFSGATTAHFLHGVAEDEWVLGENNNCRRVCWFFLFSIAVVLSAWSLIRAHEEHSNYETVYELNHVTIGAVEFPQVTLCDLNPVSDKRFWEVADNRKAEARSEGVQESDLKLKKLKLKNADLPYLLEENKDRTVLAEYSRVLGLKKDDVTSNDVWTYGWKLSDLFPAMQSTVRTGFSKFFESSCYFGVSKAPCFGKEAGRSTEPIIPRASNGIIFSSNGSGEFSDLSQASRQQHKDDLTAIDAGNQNGTNHASMSADEKEKTISWTRTLDPVYGYCYTFDTKLLSYGTGLGTGLELKLQLPRSRVDNVNFTPMRGLRLALHSRGRDFTMRDGITIGPGQAVEIGIAKSSVNTSDVSSWGNDPGCDSTEGYTQRQCLDECVQRVTFDDCNCFPGWVDPAEAKSLNEQISKKMGTTQTHQTCQVKIAAENAVKRKQCADALFAKQAADARAKAAAQGTVVAAPAPKPKVKIGSSVEIKLEFSAMALATPNWATKVAASTNDVVKNACDAILKGLSKSGANDWTSSRVSVFTCALQLAGAAGNTNNASRHRRLTAGAPAVVTHKVGWELSFDVPDDAEGAKDTELALVELAATVEDGDDFAKDIQQTMATALDDLSVATCTGTTTNGASCSDTFATNVASAITATTLTEATRHEQEAGTCCCPAGCVFTASKMPKAVVKEPVVEATETVTETVEDQLEQFKEAAGNVEPFSYDYTKCTYFAQHESIKYGEYEYRTLDNAPLNANANSDGCACVDGWYNISKYGMNEGSTWAAWEIAPDIGSESPDSGYDSFMEKLVSGNHFCAKRLIIGLSGKGYDNGKSNLQCSESSAACNASKIEKKPSSNPIEFLVKNSGAVRGSCERILIRKKTAVPAKPPVCTTDQITCQNGGTIVTGLCGACSCQCDDRHEGDNCEKVKADAPALCTAETAEIQCQNGGTLVGSVPNCTCECATPNSFSNILKFTGALCETAVCKDPNQWEGPSCLDFKWPDCVLGPDDKPCLHGGIPSGKQGPPGVGKCVCDCSALSMWEGPHCDTCAASSTCGTNGTMEKDVAEDTCKCKCKPGYGGQGCDMFFCSFSAPLHGSLGDCPGHDEPFEAHLLEGNSCSFMCPETHILAPGENVCERPSSSSNRRLHESDDYDTRSGERIPAVCIPKCDFTTAPANGTKGDCGVLLPTKDCQPTCNQGYKVSGKSTCSALGVPLAATCNCQFSAPSNGTIGNCPVSGIPPGSFCTPTCNAGYSLSGTGLNRCAAQTGIKTEVQCIKNCDFTTLKSGFKNAGDCTNNVTPGSSCTPVCLPNYRLQGDGKNVCTATGQKVFATCAPLCTFSAPANGIVGTCSGPIAVGEECVPTCNAGYVAVGGVPNSFPPKNHCYVDSSAEEEADFTPVTCNCKFTVPLNGAAGSCNQTSGIAAASSCDITCNAGLSPSKRNNCPESGARDVTQDAICEPAETCLFNVPAFLPDHYVSDQKQILVGGYGTCGTTPLLVGQTCEPQCNAFNIAHGSTGRWKFALTTPNICVSEGSNFQRARCDAVCSFTKGPRQHGSNSSSVGACGGNGGPIDTALGGMCSPSCTGASFQNNTRGWMLQSPYFCSLVGSANDEAKCLKSCRFSIPAHGILVHNGVDDVLISDPGQGYPNGFFPITFTGHQNCKTYPKAFVEISGGRVVDTIGVSRGDCQTKPTGAVLSGFSVSSPAVLTVDVKPDLQDIVIEQQGTGYSGNGNLVFSGHSCTSNPAGTYTVVNGKVTSVNITSRGSCAVLPTSVTLSNNNGNGAILRLDFGCGLVGTPYTFAREGDGCSVYCDPAVDNNGRGYALNWTHDSATYGNIGEPDNFYQCPTSGTGCDHLHANLIDGNNNCCHQDAPCELYEGNCSSNDQCKHGLTCGAQGSCPWASVDGSDRCCVGTPTLQGDLWEKINAKPPRCEPACKFTLTSNMTPGNCPGSSGFRLLFGQSCTPQCANGFTLRGSNKIQCYASEQAESQAGWTMPYCAKTCSFDNPPNNAFTADCINYEVSPVAPKVLEAGVSGNDRCMMGCGRQIVTIGDSDGNSKQIVLPHSGISCPVSLTIRHSINYDGTDFPDRWATSINGKVLTVTRVDQSGGWGHVLEIYCYNFKPAYNHGQDANWVFAEESYFKYGFSITGPHICQLNNQNFQEPSCIHTCLFDVAPGALPAFPSNQNQSNAFVNGLGDCGNVMALGTSCTPTCSTSIINGRKKVLDKPFTCTAAMGIQTAAGKVGGVCRTMCSSMHQIPNSLPGNCDQWINLGQSCEPSCQDGYEFANHQHETFTCFEATDHESQISPRHNQSKDYVMPACVSMSMRNRNRRLRRKVEPFIYRRVLNAPPTTELTPAEALVAVQAACKAPPFATEVCVSDILKGAHRIATKLDKSNFAPKVRSSDGKDIDCGCKKECVSVEYDMRVSQTPFPAETAASLNDLAVNICRAEMKAGLGNVFSDINAKCNGKCGTVNCFGQNGLFEDVYNNRACDSISFGDIVKTLVEVETLLEYPADTPMIVNRLPDRYACDSEIFGTAPLPCNERDKGHNDVLNSFSREKLRLKLAREADAINKLLEDAAEVDFTTIDGGKETLSYAIKASCGSGTMEPDIEIWKKAGSPRQRFHTNAVKDARQSALSLSIYFRVDDESVAEIKKKTTLQGFFANVGGMFGLLAGASVLTLVETFEFIGAMLFMYYIPWDLLPCFKKGSYYRNVTTKEGLSTLLFVSLWVGMIISGVILTERIFENIE
eukprot:g3056.t1